jgi:hypothetical protein
MPEDQDLGACIAHPPSFRSIMDLAAPQLKLLFIQSSLASNDADNSVR